MTQRLYAAKTTNRCSKIYCKIAVFEKYFSDGSFNDKLDLTRLAQELPDRIEQTVNAASPPQRMQLLHDLCVVARADDQVTAEEHRLLSEIATSLGVAQAFIDQCLECSVELD